MAIAAGNSRGNGGVTLQLTPGDGQACASRHSDGKAAVKTGTAQALPGTHPSPLPPLPCPAPAHPPLHSRQGSGNIHESA